MWTTKPCVMSRVKQYCHSHLEERGTGRGSIGQSASQGLWASDLHRNMVERTWALMCAPMSPWTELNRFQQQLKQNSPKLHNFPLYFHNLTTKDESPSACLSLSVPWSGTPPPQPTEIKPGVKVSWDMRGLSTCGMDDAPFAIHNNVKDHCNKFLCQVTGRRCKLHPHSLANSMV